MQVMYWFIILNMKLTLNHAVVDLSHALTRKSIALLPIILCKKIVSFIRHRYNNNNNIAFFPKQVGVG